MDRLNQEGIPRGSLTWAFRRPDVVCAARTRDRCLLCGQRKVNRAGVCEGCYSLLDTAELAVAERLLAGGSV